MSLEAFRLIDGSSAASLTFTGTPAVRLGDASLLGEALDWSLMGLAAETTGIMETLNRATFEYLRTRKQFGTTLRSEEHTSELQSLMRISYAVFCLKQKK